MEHSLSSLCSLFDENTRIQFESDNNKNNSKKSKNENDDKNDKYEIIIRDWQKSFISIIKCHLQNRPLMNSIYLFANSLTPLSNGELVIDGKEFRDFERVNIYNGNQIQNGIRNNDYEKIKKNEEVIDCHDYHNYFNNNIYDNDNNNEDNNTGNDNNNDNNNDKNNDNNNDKNNYDSRNNHRNNDNSIDIEIRNSKKRRNPEIEIGSMSDYKNDKKDKKEKRKNEEKQRKKDNQERVKLEIIEMEKNAITRTEIKRKKEEFNNFDSHTNEKNKIENFSELHNVLGILDLERTAADRLARTLKTALKTDLSPTINHKNAAVKITDFQPKFSVEFEIPGKTIFGRTKNVKNDVNSFLSNCQDEKKKFEDLLNFVEKNDSMKNIQK